MMKEILFLAITLLVTACATSQTVTSHSKEDLVEEWTPKVGVATRSDFVEKFGNAEWCRRRDSGAETCRFYNKKGVKWLGTGQDKKSYIQYDQVVADFDGNGILRSFEGDSQR